jgi:hypothetical protein
MKTLICLCWGSIWGVELFWLVPPAGINRTWHQSRMVLIPRVINRILYRSHMVSISHGVNRAWRQSQMVPIADGINRTWCQSRMTSISHGVSRTWHQLNVVSIAHGVSRILYWSLLASIACGIIPHILSFAHGIIRTRYQSQLIQRNYWLLMKKLCRGDHRDIAPYSSLWPSPFTKTRCLVGKHPERLRTIFALCRQDFLPTQYFLNLAVPIKVWICYYALQSPSYLVLDSSTNLFIPSQNRYTS